MLGLVKFVLCYEYDADITMLTTFRKEIAHKYTGICVVQQVIQYEYTRLTAGAGLRNNGCSNLTRPTLCWE